MSNLFYPCLMSWKRLYLIRHYTPDDKCYITSASFAHFLQSPKKGDIFLYMLVTRHYLSHLYTWSSLITSRVTCVLYIGIAIIARMKIYRAEPRFIKKAGFPRIYIFWTNECPSKNLHVWANRGTQCPKCNVSNYTFLAGQQLQHNIYLYVLILCFAWKLNAFDTYLQSAAAKRKNSHEK